jgi:histidinol-phosphate aminotransferase
MNIRLHANENFYGCSATVKDAILPLVSRVHEYPDVPDRLREALADKFNVSFDSVLIAGGSVRLIDGILQTLCNHNDEIIIFDRSFVAYKVLAESHGRNVIMAPQTNFICHPESALQLITPRTRILFLANPNNPTGTYINHHQLEQLLCALPERVLLVLDEAYGEYATATDFPDSRALLSKYANLIILRTFSKIYGLAGLRTGYAIMNEHLAKPLRSTRIPYFTSIFSEAAALAALHDTDFIEFSRTQNHLYRNKLYTALQSAGYMVPASEANFLYLHFSDENQKNTLHKKLLQNNLLICNLDVFGQSHALRIGIGDAQTCARIEELI